MIINNMENILLAISSSDERLKVVGLIICLFIGVATLYAMSDTYRRPGDRK